MQRHLDLTFDLAIVTLTYKMTFRKLIFGRDIG